MRHRASAQTAAVPCGGWVRTSPSSSTIYPPHFGSCATSNRGSAAGHESASCRHRCRPCLSNAAALAPGCSRMCWCPNMPTTCRFYRQPGIYARRGVDLARSALADWVGRSAALLDPLVDALECHVMGGATLPADDTPVPVPAPGAGRTRTGWLWTYGRDERGAGGEARAALFRYAPDRKGERPARHFARFRSDLHPGGHAGFGRLYGDRIRQVALGASQTQVLHAAAAGFRTLPSSALGLATGSMPSIIRPIGRRHVKMISISFQEAAVWERRSNGLRQPSSSLSISSLWLS